jgi:hypothetical protein
MAYLFQHLKYSFIPKNKVIVVTMPDSTMFVLPAAFVYPEPTDKHAQKSFLITEIIHAVNTQNTSAIDQSCYLSLIDLQDSTFSYNDTAKKGDKDGVLFNTHQQHIQCILNHKTALQFLLALQNVENLASYHAVTEDQINTTLEAYALKNLPNKRLQRSCLYLHCLIIIITLAWLALVLTAPWLMNMHSHSFRWVMVAISLLDVFLMLMATMFHGAKLYNQPFAENHHGTKWQNGLAVVGFIGQCMCIMMAVFLMLNMLLSILPALPLNAITLAIMSALSAISLGIHQYVKPVPIIPNM